MRLLIKSFRSTFWRARFFGGLVLLIGLAIIWPLLRPVELISPPAASEPVFSQTQTATSTLTRVSLVRVVDGDTILVRQGSDTFYVRLLGINAPESVDPKRPVECFGQEAAGHLSVLLAQIKQLNLWSDPSQSSVDKYGRHLAYVETTDGFDFGLKMIQDGFAYEYTYDLPYKRQASYRQAEHLARAKQLGLWSTQSGCRESL